MGLKIKIGGWVGEQFDRAGKAVSDAAKDVKKEAGKTAGDLLRGAAAAASFGTSELLGVGKTIGQLNELAINELTGEGHRQRKEAKANKLAAINAAEAEAKRAADEDYYNRIMKARDKQVAAYLDSQTDLTQEGEALGDYGKSLGSFGNTALGGKKKKMYY